MQDASQMSQWQVPTNTITLVGRMLKPGEDEIAQVVNSLVRSFSCSRHQAFLGG